MILSSFYCLFKISTFHNISSNNIRSGKGKHLLPSTTYHWQNFETSSIFFSYLIQDCLCIVRRKMKMFLLKSTIIFCKKNLSIIHIFFFLNVERYLLQLMKVWIVAQTCVCFDMSKHERMSFTNSKSYLLSIFRKNELPHVTPDCWAHLPIIDLVNWNSRTGLTKIRFHFVFNRRIKNWRAVKHRLTVIYLYRNGSASELQTINKLYYKTRS